MKSNKIYAIIITTLVIAFIIIATITIRNNIKADKAAEKAWMASREIKVIIVQPGDTLSGLYYEYDPKGIDMFPWITQVQELNNMSSCNIYVGQELKIYIN